MNAGCKLPHEDVAVIGIAGRFPGAKTVQAFWQNLHAGVESLTFFTDHELMAEGHDSVFLSDPDYVKAGAVVEDIELFDAAFFGMDAETATQLEPGHRLLLELVSEALEQAGLPLCNLNGQQFLAFLNSDAKTYRYTRFKESMQSVEEEARGLASLLAQAFSLPPSSISVQNEGCTGLATVHHAYEALQNGACKVALAGAALVSVPQKTGYFAFAGGGYSADGHCLAFDEKASGTVPGNGGGVVVLKRLNDALDDGDTVYAVIKGSAIHQGDQRMAIREAIQKADIDPNTIRYVEAHGSAMQEADAAEIAALSAAFGVLDGEAEPCAVGTCAVGTVQANIGHLGAASGMAGLIKAILAVQQGKIPPMPHLKKRNQNIDFPNRPFYVNAAVTEWPLGQVPRRAGVHSAGLDSSYAHVILEEAPARQTASSSRPSQLLLFSAKTSSVLEAYTEQLQADLAENPERSLADTAYTLHTGRQTFEHRRMAVCRDATDAANTLAGRLKQRVFTSVSSGVEPEVVFLFPGLGSHYVQMGGELYVTEPIFKHHVDRCCELLQPLLGLDLRDVLYPSGPQIVAEQGIDLRKLLRRGNGEGNRQEDEASAKLNQTALAHTSLFVIEFALSQLLIEWGVRPQALLGHSLGEYVTACLAGVFSLEDALTLVARRAQMIQALPGGAMLAVSLSEKDLQPYLDESLHVAIVNSPIDCMVSGTIAAIENLQNELKEKYVPHHRLEASHGFHSPMLAAMADEFARLVESCERQAPRIPILSNVTGTWMTPEQATDPEYWAKHLCQKVRFAEGLQELGRNRKALLLEVGPGNTLSSFVHQTSKEEDLVTTVFATMRHSSDKRSDTAFLQTALGRMWLEGVTFDGAKYYAQESRMRVPLPTTVFERQRFWR